MTAPTDWTRRTMVVPAALVAGIRQLAVSIAGPSAEGMWTAGCGPTADAPPTHYITEGAVQQQFADLIESPDALSAATGMPIEQAAAILSACIVSQDDPHVVMAAHGLVLTAPSESAE